MVHQDRLLAPPFEILKVPKAMVIAEVTEELDGVAVLAANTQLRAARTKKFVKSPWDRIVLRVTRLRSTEGAPTILYHPWFYQ